MPESQPSVSAYSRRGFLALAASAGVAAQHGPARAETLPSEAKRYADGATEFTVVRLTDPTYSSYLTASYNRCIGSRGFVLHSSDRAGSADVYRLDLKSGASQRLTGAKQLDPRSVALLPNDRSFCYMDGPSLRSMSVGGLRDRDIYSATAPFDEVTACALNPEGTHAYLVERKPGRNRVRMVSIARGSAATVMESGDDIGMPLPRPGGGLAYRRGNDVYLSARSGNESPLPFAAGRVASALWSPGGASLLYLSLPERAGELNAIRECVVAGGQDKLVAKTTQFVQFAMNADASVFAGASGSKASPHILILIRSVRRELTVCEHRARDGRTVALAFSPNSQRVVFQSDQHGKPAIYSVAVERFVEETES